MMEPYVTRDGAVHDGAVQAVRNGAVRDALAAAASITAAAAGQGPCNC